MNKSQLKTIGLPCFITAVVGIILTCWVLPAVLALALAATLPLSDLFTDGMVLFWAMSFLQMTVLIILYVIALLLLLKWFRGKERLISLIFAIVVSACLLFLHRHVLHNNLLLLQLIIWVVLIVAVSLIIVWRKTKQPVPATTEKSIYSKPDKQENSGK